MIIRLIAYIIANTVAVLTVGSLSEQRLVEYQDRAAVFIFAIILGLINAYIRPVVRFLSFPITCLTFGLFAFAINVGLFGIAALLTPGMQVTFWGAVLGAVIASVASGIIFSLVDE